LYSGTAHAERPMTVEAPEKELPEEEETDEEEEGTEEEE
jgi:hypothetical protein